MLGLTSSKDGNSVHDSTEKNEQLKIDNQEEEQLNNWRDLVLFDENKNIVVTFRMKI